MTENSLELAKKVTIYGVAILTVIAVSGALSSFGMRLIVLPKMQEMIAEEREARQHADEVIIGSVTNISRDRIRLISIMEERSAQERVKLLQQFRKELEIKGGTP